MGARRAAARLGPESLRAGCRSYWRAVSPPQPQERPRPELPQARAGRGEPVAMGVNLGPGVRWFVAGSGHQVRGAGPALTRKGARVPRHRGVGSPSTGADYAVRGSNLRRAAGRRRASGGAPGRAGLRLASEALESSQHQRKITPSAALVDARLSSREMQRWGENYYEANLLLRNKFRKAMPTKLLGRPVGREGSPPKP